MSEPEVKESDLWETPPEIFDPLKKEFKGFDLDAAAVASNAKAPVWFGKQADGSWIDSLSQDWTKYKKIWVNPPYSKEGNKDGFVKKAFEAAAAGCLVVMLLPVKTDTISFHDYIYDRRAVEVRFLKGRVRFIDPLGKRQSVGRFASMVVIFHPNKPRKYSYL